MYMKIGTLVHHVHGYKISEFLVFAQGLSYGLSKLKKKTGKKSLNFENPNLVLGQKLKV